MKNNASLTNILNIELPVIQAPMAGAQGSDMAIAVSEAGGLGSLPCAMLTIDGMQQALSAIEARTDKPINVNFFCHRLPRIDLQRQQQWLEKLTPYYREYGIDPASVSFVAGRAAFNRQMADAIAGFRPQVVSFHFGLPEAALLEQVKSWGAKVVSSATTVAEAIWLEQHGADIIIAQGLEAGGHRGHFLSDDLNQQLPLADLLPRVLQVVNLPVVAAGGIGSAADVARAISLGAAGVQVGTAYLLCQESLISDVHRAALTGPQATETALTNLFTGRPARGIINRFMQESGPLNDSVPDFPLATSAVMPLRSAAEKQQRGDFSPLWAGQNTTGCKAVSAARLTRELAAALR
ncbi:nitronate monooxygenase [Chromatiaceae bacterium AAb-1]|nr:nitronate monooxygenase [Chromatiaceae bacterium AAb-1]